MAQMTISYLALMADWKTKLTFFKKKLWKKILNFIHTYIVQEEFFFFHLKTWKIISQRPPNHLHYSKPWSHTLRNGGETCTHFHCSTVHYGVPQGVHLQHWFSYSVSYCSLCARHSKISKSVQTETINVSGCEKRGPEHQGLCILGLRHG